MSLVTTIRVAVQIWIWWTDQKHSFLKTVSIFLIRGVPDFPGSDREDWLVLRAWRCRVPLESFSLAPSPWRLSGVGWCQGWSPPNGDGVRGEEPRKTRIAVKGTFIWLVFDSSVSSTPERWVSINTIAKGRSALLQTNTYENVQRPDLSCGEVS